jgi:hypothetical protein
MLKYRSVDLQTANIHLDLASGYAEPPDVRGEDDVIPGAAGREPGTRRADVRRIVADRYRCAYGRHGSHAHAR